MKRLLILAIALALWSGVAYAETPARVRAMCGDQPVSWDSLCNVEPELHDAFILIERIGGDPDFLLRNRLSAMIRDRHAAIDWHPNAGLSITHPGLLGMHDPSTSRVYVPQLLKHEPLRVKTSVLAHELTHAIWDVDGLGFGMSAAQACLENEALAYKVGVIIYARVYFMTGEGDRPRSGIDRELLLNIFDWWHLSGGQDFTARGLDLLADQHLRSNGYLGRCARL